MTEYELFQALRPMYPAAEYALLPQTANGTGSRANRHADALALGLWPSRGLYLHGFEIKSYRGDWIRELKNPAKAEEISKFCNYWWIVAAGPFVKLDELPRTWGLLEWKPDTGKLIKARLAPFREASPPDIPFIAAMLRKAQEVVTPAAEMDRARSEAYAKGKKEADELHKFELEQRDKLKKRLDTFEDISGIKIDGWNDAGDIGAAVNEVLHGTVNRRRSQLLAVAETIVKELRGGE